MRTTQPLTIAIPETRMPAALLLGSLALIACLISIKWVDHRAFYFFQSLKINPDTVWISAFAKTFSNAGELSWWAALALMLLLGTLGLKHSHKLYATAQDAALRILCALIASGVTVWLLKMIFSRGRPSELLLSGQDVFFSFQALSGMNSFPSGHTATIFTIAAIAACYRPQQRVFIYLLAALVGFARAVACKHFISDVIMGAYVGWLAARPLCFSGSPKVKLSFLSEPGAAWHAALPVLIAFMSVVVYFHAHDYAANELFAADGPIAIGSIVLPCFAALIAFDSLRRYGTSPGYTPDMSEMTSLVLALFFFGYGALVHYQFAPSVTVSELRLGWCLFTLWLVFYIFTLRRRAAAVSQAISHA